MEHRVNLEVVGELEFIGRGGDDFGDRIGSDEFRLKFLEGSLFLRRRVKVSGG